MRFRDAVFAVPTSVIWGLAVVETKLGLESSSATELTAPRDLTRVALGLALAGVFRWAAGQCLGWVVCGH